MVDRTNGINKGEGKSLYWTVVIGFTLPTINHKTRLNHRIDD